MVNEVLGRNIRKYRLELGWTQEKLAVVICVSHQVISKWESLEEQLVSYPTHEKLLFTMLKLLRAMKY